MMFVGKKRNIICNALRIFELKVLKLISEDKNRMNSCREIIFYFYWSGSPLSDRLIKVEDHKNRPGDS